jgi:hypothetical protein
LPSQIVIDNGEFVAKKLVDIGNGRETLTITKQCELLTADLVRLKRMAYFARLFVNTAVQKAVEISGALSTLSIHEKFSQIPLF